jgi:hypothetical protein
MRRLRSIVGLLPVWVARGQGQAMRPLCVRHASAGCSREAYRNEASTPLLSSGDVSPAS